MDLQQIIDECNKIVFFGGAGVSTESGIPDFRSVDGLYNQKYDYPPEEILSHTFFYSHTIDFFKFYRDKMLIENVKPNKAHLKLAELEKAGKLSAVVTQNIDGLHQAAGSKKYMSFTAQRLEIIAQNAENSLMQTISKQHPYSLLRRMRRLGKPDVVLYEEGLDGDTVNGALEAISNADCLIIAGTSLTVYPAASFVRYFRGKYLVLINRDETPMDKNADLVIHDKVGEVLSKIKV